MLSSSNLPSLLLFDVGNVLLELRPWHEALPVGQLPPGVDPGKAIEALLGSEVYSRFERGQAELEEFYAEVRRVFSSELPDEEIKRRFLALLGPPMEGMTDLLRELRSRGSRLAGLSDTTPIHLEALPGYPSVALLERLVTSCETGFVKPSPEAFETALHLLGVDPATTVFVDDLARNVEGARAVGMRAVVFESAAELRQLLGVGSATGS